MKKISQKTVLRVTGIRAFAAVVIFSTTPFSFSIVAQTLPSPPAMQSGERRGPPPESIAACKSLKAEQACAFTSPKGPETGTCVQRDANAPLACRPTRSGPPPEAFAACKSKTINASCSVNTPEGAAAGSCAQAESGGALVCQPAAKK